MVNTNDFRTKTIIKSRNNLSNSDYYPIALDIGYSGVKGFFPNGIFAFPSFAKKIGKTLDLCGIPDPFEIIYKDEDSGDYWRVGREAQKMISNFDTNDSSNELFARDRYYTPMFLVIARVGIALALYDNSKTEKKIIIQTGLPPAYLDEDSPMLKDILSGHHNFSIKIGNKSFKNFDFNIEHENIRVMSQPMGTLISVSQDDTNHTIPAAADFFKSNAVIFDCGYGTLDIFELRNRKISAIDTFSEYGMNAIFDKTAALVKEKYNTVIRVPAIQSFLETGQFSVNKRDRNKISSHNEDLAPILESASKEICEEAIEKILNIYHGLAEDKYLIITGGTGKAWEPYIREAFADNENVKIIMGNQNTPDVDIIFANVRGYYMSLMEFLRKKSG